MCEEDALREAFRQTKVICQCKFV